MFQERIESEEYFDQFFLEELAFQDEEDNRQISEESMLLADNLFNVLQDLIDKNLTEESTSLYSAQDHYRWHCLNNRNLKSIKTNVYYDFNKYSDYLDYEKRISSKTLSKDKIFIKDFIDGEEIVAAFRKLFEGNTCLVFGLGCGFHNKTGGVRLCINSFATDYTKNYLNNTVDFLVQAPDNKTISLYPLDANYLETKLNNEIAKIPSAVRLNINR